MSITDHHVKRWPTYFNTEGICDICEGRGNIQYVQYKGLKKCGVDFEVGKGFCTTRYKNVQIYFACEHCVFFSRQFKNRPHMTGEQISALKALREELKKEKGKGKGVAGFGLAGSGGSSASASATINFSLAHHEVEQTNQIPDRANYKGNAESQGDILILARLKQMEELIFARLKQIEEMQQERFNRSRVEQTEEIQVIEKGLRHVEQIEEMQDQRLNHIETQLMQQIPLDQRLRHIEQIEEMQDRRLTRIETLIANIGDQLLTLIDSLQNGRTQLQTLIGKFCE